MDEQVVERRGLDLKDDPELLSPPWLGEPLYQCATAVTVFGFLPHADIDVEVDGSVVVSATVGFSEPIGATLALPAALVAGQNVPVRQRLGALASSWSPAVVVRDHTVDYPAGPPRPQIDPAPVLRCGSRTGVANLLGGGNVWITADGAEVGRVDGCGAPRQGVNINPIYGLGKRYVPISSCVATPARRHWSLSRSPGRRRCPARGLTRFLRAGNSYASVASPMAHECR